MQSDKTGKCPPEEGSGDVSELKVVSAKEALRRDLKSLQVPASTDVMFSPYDSEFAPYFARVEVKDFDDLKVLGFVPRGLAEEKVRSAIAADENEAYKVAHTMLANSPAPNCTCQHPQTTVVSGSNLRQHYASARKSFNPALARVLTEHLQTRVEWDSPIASIVRNWMRFIEISQRSAISIALLNDITIDRGAVLRLDKSTKALFAGTIYIHRTGQLIYDGGYLKIWAHAISNLLTFATSATNLSNIPWLISNK